MKLTKKLKIKLEKLEELKNKRLHYWYVFDMANFYLKDKETTDFIKNNFSVNEICLLLKKNFNKLKIGIIWTIITGEND